MTADDIWKRAVDIAQIVSALATFATVVVATRLWSKQFSPRIKVSIDETRVFNPVHNADYIGISVVNVGLTPCIVSGLQYRPFRRFKERWFQIPDWTNPLSAQLPLRLEPGDTKQFFFPPEEWFESATDMILKRYLTSFAVRALWRRGFRVEALTTTGEAFAARPPRRMIEKLEQRLWDRLTAQAEERP